MRVRGLNNANDTLIRNNNGTQLQGMTYHAEKALEQKILIPYYLNNQTKLFFKEGDSDNSPDKLLSIMDLIRVFTHGSQNAMTFYFKSV